jgi:NAD(P)-dependent dehydrogenase (short-subunit alcohol dehydrogenase family)
MQIKGKNALITGGAIRIGKAITLGLAQAGANVAINYNRDAEEAAKTAREAQALGVATCVVQANIADWEQVQKMFTQIHAELGKIDILINNASTFIKTPFPTDSLDAWHTVIGVSVNGPFYVSNLAAKDMLEKEEGAIINIVDLTAWEAWPEFTGHAVAKSALLTMTRQMAVDLRPNIRVNAVAPGPVLAPPDYSPERIRRTAAKTLVDRWGKPEDVSRTVNFLIESDYINADTITVDGGQRHAYRKQEAG